MTAFKALLVKDLQANRKLLMIPVWFLIVMYAILAFSIIYAVSSGQNNGLTISGIPVSLLSNSNLHRMMSFMMQTAMFVSFLSLIFMIAVSLLGSTLLNQDIRNKCELFHRSQPVPVWKLTLARFTAGLGGLVAIAFILGFINMIVANILASILTPMQVNWWMSLNGLLLSWLHFSIALLVLGSILFVFSAIFKDHAFGLGVGGLTLLQLVALFLNKLYGWHIPYILNAIFKLITSGIAKIQYVLPPSQQFGLVHVKVGQETDYANFVIPQHFLYNLWTTLFSWDILFKLVFCAAMYLLATYIYKQREVQF